MSFQSPITDEGSTRGLIELRDHAAVRLALRVAVDLAILLADVVVLVIVTAFPPLYLSSLILSLPSSCMVSNSPSELASRRLAISFR